MKRLIKLVVFVVVLAVAAVAAVYELCPDSAAARFIDPYCRDYYFAARGWTLSLVDRCRGGKDEAASEEPAEAPIIDLPPQRQREIVKVDDMEFDIDDILAEFK